MPLLPLLEPECPPTAVEPPAEDDCSVFELDEHPKTRRIAALTLTEYREHIFRLLCSRASQQQQQVAF